MNKMGSIQYITLQLMLEVIAQKRQSNMDGGM